MLILRAVSSFSHFQLSIPNGERVPSPCERGQIWIGVGHRSPAGANARNPFGLDFAAHDNVGAIFEKYLMLFRGWISLFLIFL